VIWWGLHDSDGNLRIWDARTGQVVSRLELGTPDAFWRTVSEDGRTGLSVYLKGSVPLRFHDLTTGKVTREVPGGAQNPPIILSPAGDKMVCAHGTLMTVADCKEILNVGHFGWPNPTVRFSSDGRRLMAAVVAKHPEWGDVDLRDGPPAEEIAVFDAVEGKELRRFANVVGTFQAIDGATLSRDGKTVVTVWHAQKSDDQIITLWETETGRERGHFIGHRGPAICAAVSPDGRFVVTGASDTTALVWDATRPQSRKAATRRVSAAADVAVCFKDLAGDNAEQAYVAMWALVNAPKETVSFLRDQDSLFTTTDVQMIRRWIRDLDSDEFAERERASQELGLILDEAEPHLKKALPGASSLELRRRIDDLLERHRDGLTGRHLQKCRVIEVLERIAAPGADATRPAVALLRKFAAGAPEARLTQEAKASLERLER
jgi:hypothetical protein